MSALTVAAALEAVYTSLHDNNENLDAHIAGLKGALAAEGKKEALVDTKRLAQSNRQGRKLMQAYFKKRGVTVTFAEVG